MLLEERIKQLKNVYDDLPRLEDYYCKCCNDYGLLSVEMVNSLKDVQNCKKELKKHDFNSMAEFEREYELQDEFLILKSTKYQLKGFERLLSGIKVRIESLKAQLRGEY